MRDRYDVMEYPVGISYWAWGGSPAGLRVYVLLNSQPELCAIASVSSTPGMMGKPGNAPEDGVLLGTCALTVIVVVDVEVDDAVN